jgi:hypothetical protein
MRKATLKVIQYTSAGFLLLIALPAVLLYVAATRAPSDYHPLGDRLTEQQRKGWANHCISNYFTNFHSKTEDIHPFTWSLTEEQLNLYVSSIDEIAWMGQFGVGGPVRPQMANLGLSGWCIALTDDGIKIMVRSTRYDKILSATLTFKTDSENRMRVRVERARMGVLVIPKSVIIGTLAKLKDQMARWRKEESDPKKRSGGKTVGNLGALLENVLQMAVDDKPGEATLSGFVKPTKIERVDTSGGTLTIHLRPVHRGQLTSESTE